MNTKTPVQQVLDACNKLEVLQQDQQTLIMIELIKEECNRQLQFEKDLIVNAFADGNNIAQSELKLTAAKYLKHMFTEKTKDENTNAELNLLHGGDSGRNKKRSKKKAA